MLFDDQIGDSALEYEARAPHPNPLPAQAGRGRQDRATEYLTITSNRTQNRAPDTGGISVI